MAMSVAMLAAEGAAEGGEVLHELPMAPYLYGLIALALFALALAVTWAFRGTAAKARQSRQECARTRPRHRRK